MLGLILYGSRARYAWAPDYPMGMKREDYLARREEIAAGWGTFQRAQREVERSAPSLAGDVEYVGWWAKLERYGASPAAALAFEDVWYETDVRPVLGSVQAPTLVLCRTTVDGPSPSRDLADRIPGAKYVQFSGRDYYPETGNMDEILDAAERFVQSIRAEETDINRVLATVLFTDIVDSTAKAAELRDAGWKDLVERHHRTVRAMIGRYRGREIDTAGDGFFAAFDGPARAVRCALAIVEAVKPIGLEVRAGLHTGEVETIDGKIGGIAVMIGARIGQKALRSEVLASSTVRDLTAGSGLVFEDHGDHELKGVPGGWRLYAVVAD